MVADTIFLEDMVNTKSFLQVFDYEAKIFILVQSEFRDYQESTSSVEDNHRPLPSLNHAKLISKDVRSSISRQPYAVLSILDNKMVSRLLPPVLPSSIVQASISAGSLPGEAIGFYFSC
ncbi:hypothetical protein EC973_009152 [Apophysomyces ossiformis]|uniref:Uncharacterized protein n=1 Tax=Apophysomyces ossiformis TaxID=679940 RepID=A0A8H7BMM8_9FUNG|nr:hypothetical protein EC973_009152 [Apophysomyces ossiformis]